MHMGMTLSIALPAGSNTCMKRTELEGLAIHSKDCAGSGRTDDVRPESSAPQPGLPADRSFLAGLGAILAWSVRETQAQNAPLLHSSRWDSPLDTSPTRE
jgi:hypothetical protein